MERLSDRIIQQFLSKEPPTATSPQADAHLNHK